MRIFALFILKHAHIMLAFFVTATVLFGYVGSNLQIDNSIRTGFPTGNKDFQELEEFLQEFEGDELIVVAYESENIFSQEHLLAIENLSRQIEKLDNVLRVTSLTTVSDFEVPENYPGKLHIVDFIKRSENSELLLPNSQEAFLELRKQATENSMLVDNIVSRDGNTTAIAAYIRSIPSDTAYKARLVRQISEILARSDLDVRFHLAGPPVYSTAMEQSASRDLGLFTVVVAIVIAALLFYVFRSFRAIVFPLLTVGMCLILTAGLMQQTVGRTTIAATILPPLLTVIGVAIAVHVISRYQDESVIGGNRPDALERTISGIGWPCLLTALTTAFGFAALSVSEIPAITETGLFASFGVMAAFLIAIAFVPIVLLYLKPARSSTRDIHPLLMKGLGGISRFNETKPVVAVILAIVLVAVSAYGISRVEVESRLSSYFTSNSDIMQAQNFVSDRLGGSSTLDIMIEVPDGASIKDIALLKKVDELEEHLRSHTITGKVFSIVDVMKYMNKKRMDEERLYDEFPVVDRQNLQSLEYFRTESGEFRQLVDERFSKLRITARLRQAGSNQVLEVVNDTEQYLEKHFAETYRTTVTGSTKIFAKISDILIEGEIRGLVLAMISISLAIIILFRNILLGIIAMIPNLIPIMLTLAVMGFAGIPINVTTAMIPCIGLGIAVDDTIHYVSRFKAELRQDGRYAEAMQRTLLSTGRPIVFTSLILFLGFMTLAFSSFLCNAYFGILIGITVASALLGDLLILPVLINIFRPIRPSPNSPE